MASHLSLSSSSVMPISLVLEVAISMVFLYLLGSQVVLSIYELWAGYRNVRGKFLYQQLLGVLGEATTQALYAEPAIARLSPAGQPPPTNATVGTARWKWGKDGLPAYIQADVFAATLLRLAAPAAPDAAALLAGAPKLSPEAASLLAGLLTTLEPTAPLADCQKTMAVWYDAFGERLTGWYKRRVRGWLFLIGLGVALLANIDSLYVGQYLWLHPQVSHALADAAARRAREARTDSLPPAPRAAPTDLTQALRRSVDSVNAYRAQLARLGFPVGRPATLPIDSATLPARFYVYQPQQTLRLGHTTYSVADHYLRYTLTDEPSHLNGIETHTLAWRSQAVPVDSFRADSKALDRTDVLGSAGPWLNPQPQPWWLTWLGWLLTAAALSVGAPFWFDLLCRLVNIRNLGIKPPRTGHE